MRVAYVKFAEGLPLMGILVEEPRGAEAKEADYYAGAEDGKIITLERPAEVHLVAVPGGRIEGAQTTNWSYAAISLGVHRLRLNLRGLRAIRIFNDSVIDSQPEEDFVLTAYRAWLRELEAAQKPRRIRA